MKEPSEKKERIRQELKRRLHKTTDADVRAARKAAWKKRRRTLRILAAAVVLVCAVTFLILTLREKKQFSSMALVQELELQGEGNSFEAYDEGILRYSSNGMTYMTAEGRLIWDQAYSMKSPEPVFRGTLGLVWDRGGTGAILFDESSGCLAEIKAENELLGACLSEYGVTALMMKNNEENYIRFYDKFGAPLEIEIKNVLTGTSGYPLSMALSPDGTGLVLSLVFMNQGSMETRLSFLNFDAGKDYADRVVGLFTYPDALFPQVEYLGADRVAAFGTDRAAFFSVDGQGIPGLLKEEEYENEIRGVFAGNGMAGVISDSGRTGEELLRVYDSAGGVLFEKTLTEQYTDAEFSGEYLLLYNSSSCMILNAAGDVKYCGDSFSTISRMVSSGKNRFLLFDGSGIREVKLK